MADTTSIPTSELVTRSFDSWRTAAATLRRETTALGHRLDHFAGLGYVENDQKPGHARQLSSARCEHCGLPVICDGFGKELFFHADLLAPCARAVRHPDPKQKSR